MNLLLFLVFLQKSCINKNLVNSTRGWFSSMKTWLPSGSVFYLAEKHGHRDGDACIRSHLRSSVNPGLAQVRLLCVVHVFGSKGDDNMG